MAVKRGSSKKAAEPPVVPEVEPTVEIELTKAASYTHFGYGMTFVKGGRYTFHLSDAQELLGLHDEWGVPYFRRWAPPPPPPEEAEGLVGQKGVQTLPPKQGNDMSMADLDPERAARKEAAREAAKKANAPKPLAVNEPVVTQETEDAVDSGEIDTGEGVDI